MTEAEVGGMWPQAEEHLEPPEAARGGKRPSREPLDGAWLCPQLEFGLQNSKNINVCHMKPRGMQS